MKQSQLQRQYTQTFFEEFSIVRPFLKWAGGKGQLLDELEARFPKDLKLGKIKKYFEPFVGGGAVFFLIASKYCSFLKYMCLNDVNQSLMLVYKVVQSDAHKLITELESLSSVYQAMDQNDREILFYNIRDEYNSDKKRIDFRSYNTSWVGTAAKMIFLNKTCFNGLYRENRKGDFNVPFGRYKNPGIFDTDCLINASESLENVEIESSDFTAIEKYVDDSSFVYFDPPYRPISKTSSFTSYNGNEFVEDNQIRLAHLYRALDKRGAKLLLSNSDPKNENPADNFFEKHYKGFNIARVAANRMINCDASKRGAIQELVITNY